MAKKYDLRRSGPQYFWNLKSANNDKVLTGAIYDSRQGALNAIESCRESSAIEARYDRKASGVQHYFVLTTSSGETIGRSEMYASPAAREIGISACKQNGPNAPIEDNTQLTTND
jgi:uncharacterized protein